MELPDIEEENAALAFATSATELPDIEEENAAMSAAPEPATPVATDVDSFVAMHKESDPKAESPSVSPVAESTPPAAPGFDYNGKKANVGDFVAVEDGNGGVSLKKVNDPGEGYAVLEDVDDKPEEGKVYPTLTAVEWDEGRKSKKIRRNVSPAEYRRLQHVAETGSDLFDGRNGKVASAIADVMPFGGRNAVDKERGKIARMERYVNGKPDLSAFSKQDQERAFPAQVMLGAMGGGQQIRRMSEDEQWAEEARLLGVDAGATKRGKDEETEAYRKRLRGLVFDEMKKTVSRQDKAKQELEYIESDWKDTVFGSGRQSIGYGLEYAATAPLGGGLVRGAAALGKAIPGVAKVVGAVANSASRGAKIAKGVAKVAVEAQPMALVEAMSDYEKYRENGYTMKDGALAIESKGDDPATALVKAVKNAEMTSIVEIGMGHVTAPVLRGIGKVIGKKPIGKAIVNVAKQYGKIRQATKFGDPIEELSEENVQYFFSDVMGWGKKDSEYKGFYDELMSAFGREKLIDPETGEVRYEGSVVSGDGQYTLKGQWNTALAMLLQMGGQAAIASGAAAENVSAISRKLANLLEGTGLTKEQVANLSYRERHALANFHNHFAKSPEKLQHVLEKFGGYLGKHADEFVNQMTFKMEEDVKAYGKQPRRFKIQSRTGADGKPTPAFRESLHVDGMTGKQSVRREMYDSDSGVTIVDNGVDEDGKPSYEVYDELHRGRTFATDSFNEAKRCADLYALTNQRNFLNNRRKEQYAINLANTKFKDRNFHSVDSVDNVYALFGKAIEKGKPLYGVTDLSQIFKTDSKGEVLFPPQTREAGVNGFTCPDGTVVLILDNISTPQKMNEAMSHETKHSIGKKRSEEYKKMLMRISPDSEAGREIERIRQAYKAKGINADELKIRDEGFAYWAGRRGHNPSLMQRASHTVLGKVGQLNDADLEVIASRMEREGETGEGGTIEFIRSTDYMSDSMDMTPETETTQETTEETADETGNRADEAQPQPEQGENAEPPAAEAARPVEAAAQGGKTPRVVEPEVAAAVERAAATGKAQTVDVGGRKVVATGEGNIPDEVERGENGLPKDTALRKWLKKNNPFQIRGFDKVTNDGIESNKVGDSEETYYFSPRSAEYVASGNSRWLFSTDRDAYNAKMAIIPHLKNVLANARLMIKGEKPAHERKKYKAYFDSFDKYAVSFAIKGNDGNVEVYTGTALFNRHKDGTLYFYDILVNPKKSADYENGSPSAETPNNVSNAAPEVKGDNAKNADGQVPLDQAPQKPAENAPASAPSAEGAITQPKVTESAEGRISQSDGALTPEQAAAERKKGKRIPKSKVKTGENSASAPKTAKPIKADPKKAAAVVKNFVSKDKTRAVLQNVHHDHGSGVAVATDGRILIATKHGYDSNYKENPDAPYPNKWKDVIPDYDKGKVRINNKSVPVETVEIDHAQIDAVAKTAKRLARGLKWDAAISIPLSDGTRLTMGADNLQKVSKAMAANGLSGFKAVTGYARPILAQNEDTTIVAMPLRDNSDGELSKGGAVGRNGGSLIVFDAETGKVLSAPYRRDLEKFQVFEDEIDALMADTPARPAASASADAPAKSAPTAENAPETKKPQNGPMTESTARDGGQNSLDAYLANKKPMDAARIRKTLEKNINFGEYGIMSEAEFVEKAKRDGAEITAFVPQLKNGASGKVTYILSDGSVISKMAVDYARHIGVKVDENTVLRAYEDKDVDNAVKQYNSSLKSQGWTGGTLDTLYGDKDIQAAIDRFSGKKYRMKYEDDILAVLNRVRDARIERGDWSLTKESAAVNADKNYGTELKSVIDFVAAVESKDEHSIAKDKGRHFRFAKTSDTLKECGLTGDYFTLRAGVILRHRGKDADHRISADEWIGLSTALSEKKPMLVERYGNDGKSYRIWTEATIGGKPAVVGATVKNAGPNIEVNSISTAFGASGATPKEANIIYPKNEKEIRSVLTRHNSGRYTASPSVEPNNSATGDKVSNAVRKVNPTAPTFKRGERVFLKGAQKNQTVTFLKANADGTVDVQVKTPGANRYAPTTAETRTVPAADISATGLKTTLTASEKAAMQKGEESEAPLRADLSASEILSQKNMEGKDGKRNISPAGMPKAKPTKMKAAHDPRSLRDPKFQEWAKRKGRELTANTRRDYDREQVKAAIPLFSRLFPGLKIIQHDKVESPENWHRQHPNNAQKMKRRSPMEDPIISNIRERLRYGTKYNPKDAYHIAHSASKGEIALFHDLGGGEYVIISRVKSTDENYAKLKDFKEQLANADADAYSSLIKEAESLARGDGVSGDISSENGKGEGAVRSLVGSSASDGYGTDNSQGEGDSGNLRLIVSKKSGETLGWYSPDTKEIHLNPGADAETLMHEALHAVQDWAKENSPRLAAALEKIAQDCPRKLKQRILRTYGAVSPEIIMKEWGAFNFMGGEYGGKGEAGNILREELSRRENANWMNRFWTAVKDIWKAMMSKVGLNRVDLSAIDDMNPQQAMDFLARAMAEGKTFGKVKAKEKVSQTIDMTSHPSKVERARTAMHDWRHPLKALRDDMAKRGVEFSDETDFYEAARLQDGKNQAAKNEAERRIAEYKEMIDKAGINHADMSWFMYVQAVADRNAMIKEKFDRENGAGMSSNEAEEELARFRKSPKYADYQRISEFLQEMQTEGLQYRVDSGLLSQEQAQEWIDREPNHVPMRSAVDPETGEYVEWGKNVNSLMGKEYHTAKGRETFADDVVTWMFQEYLDAHLRGNENVTRELLANAIELGKDMGVGNVRKGPEKTFTHDFIGGEYKTTADGNGVTGDKAKQALVNRSDYRESRKNGDGGRRNVLAFKRGGNVYFIEFAEGARGETLQAAVNGRDLKRMPQWYNKIMRAWAATATSWSPTFAVRNFVADTIDLYGNYIGDSGIVQGTVDWKNHEKNLGKLSGAICRYITTGKIPEGEMGDWIRRYEKAGGMISGFKTEGYTEMSDKLSIEFKSGRNRGVAIAKAVGMAVPNTVNFLNRYSELANRIAAFKTQVEKGKSDQKAALWSRESTVDFNQKGNLTGYTNALYMFSNSTLGATARQLRTVFKSKYGKLVALAIFGYGFLEGLLEVAMGDDDEEREKKGESTNKDITEYTRANSLYVRVGGRVYRFPFHAGPFSTIKYAGNCFARMVCGKMSPTDMLKDVGLESLGVALSMIGLGNINFQSQSGTFADDAKTAIGTAVPTILQPVVQGFANIDYAGRSIYNEAFPGDKTPRSERGRRGTGEGYKAAAKWLNDATAEEGKEKGYVDLPPEVLKLAGEAVGKNVLRDVMNVGLLASMAFGDEKFDVRNVPVARDFVRPIPGNDARYNKARKDYEEHLAYYMKHYPGMASAERRNFAQKHFGRADFDANMKRNIQKRIDLIKKYQKMESGFDYVKGKAVPKEWSNAELEGFRKERLKLQAQFLKWVGE